MSYRDMGEIKKHLYELEYPPMNNTAREPIMQIIGILIELCGHLEAAQESAYSAGNKASCLANGIIPD